MTVGGYKRGGCTYMNDIIMMIYEWYMMNVPIAICSYDGILIGVNKFSGN